MPVAFFTGRLRLIHPRGVLVECLDIHGIAVMEFPHDKDLENAIALLLDLLRDRFWDQVERNAIDLLGSPGRIVPSSGIGSHLADLVGQNLEAVDGAVRRHDPDLAADENVARVHGQERAKLADLEPAKRFDIGHAHRAIRHPEFHAQDLVVALCPCQVERDIVGDVAFLYGD